MAKRMTKAEKAKRSMVEKAFYATVAGRVIPIMSIPAIYKAGERALAACEAFHLPLTEAEVKAAVEAAVNKAITEVAIAA